MIVASECSPPDAIGGDCTYGCVDCVVGYLRGVSEQRKCYRDSRWRWNTDEGKYTGNEADEGLLAVQRCARGGRARGRNRPNA